MAKDKVLLFSLTAKDFVFETFCTGGAGGQHRNAKKNGVRVRHTASGAVTEHRDGRDQRKNKEAAFEKIVDTKEFKKWHKAEVARRTGQAAYEEAELRRIVNLAVDKQMAAQNLKLEEYIP